jgi:uncharacterized protein
MPKKTGSYDRMANLESAIKNLAPVVVAFSGGADSSFLLWVCARILPARALAAVTFSSETTSRRDLLAAQATTALLKVKHFVYAGPEMQNEAYLANDLLRCYYCKRARFSFLLSQPDLIPGANIIEGSVVDDLQDYRPGMRALSEVGIASPLLEAGISKTDIGLIAADHNLHFAGQKSESCLATRIKTGHRIDGSVLRQIQAAEDAIHQRGFELIRVRWQPGDVRLEFAPEDLTRALVLRQDISQDLQKCGFLNIAIDLAGYQKSGKRED